MNVLVGPFSAQKTTGCGGIRGISAATGTSARDFHVILAQDRNPMFHGIMIVLSTGNEGISFIAAPRILLSPPEKWDDSSAGSGCFC